MERYTLKYIYTNLSGLTTPLATYLASSPLSMSLTAVQMSEVVGFIGSALFGYFYDDFIVYEGEDTTEVKATFESRCFYDIAVKLPYWYRKYKQIKQLLTDNDLSLFQSSKMTSSSNDLTKSAGGTLQKTATTPTGVSATGSTDSIDITIGSGTSDGDNDVETDGFVDKYTNAQQKFANATRVEGERSGEILREGSIEELLNVLEKLPSSFADEITKELQKHFIFDYDGLEKGLYVEL